MQPVFGHGQLRLYLLALLADGPRSGYDVIRGLEDRFDGLYVPSAGTVYPRLAKLEEEELVVRTDEGRRSSYALTDKGRAELAARSAELGELEVGLDASARRLADDMRRRVSAGAEQLRSSLDEQAQRARGDAAEYDEEVRDRLGATGTGATGTGATTGWDGRDGKIGDDSAGARRASGGSGRSEAPFGQDWAQLAGWLRTAAEQFGTAGGPLGDAGRHFGAAGRQFDPRWERWADIDLSWPPKTPQDRRHRDAAPDSPATSWANATDPAAPANDEAAAAAAPDPAAATHSAAGHDPGTPDGTAATTGSPTPEAPQPAEPRVTAEPQQADQAWPGAWGGQSRAGGANVGSGENPWAWLGVNGLPDAAQREAIGEIVRDAAERIQQVLRRGDPPPADS